MRPDRRAWSPGVPTFLEEDSNGWLVTFSDLVLQLFAFVLVAAVLGSGSAAVQTTPAAHVARPRVQVARPRVQAPAPDRARVEPPDALSLARFDDVPATVSAPAEPAPAVPAGVVSKEPTVAERIAPAPATSLAAELESFVIAEGLEEVVQVAVNGGGVTLSISDTIGFASGSADLLPDAAAVLDEVRSLIGVRPDLVVEVAGHTDDRPVHAGAVGTNLDLSLARAGRVARALAAGDPALTARVFAAGYGAARPVASNADAAGRARNRRVELRLVPGR